jgi:hypothetical protein
LMWGTLSDKRKGVCLLQCTTYSIFTFYMLLHVCIYTHSPVELALIK